MADHSIGKIFVELDLDSSRYMKSQQKLYKDATTTSLNIEQNFKNLGIRSSAEMDLMRNKINNSFNAIAHNAKATANDILRAEEAKNAKLKALNEQQYGAHVSMTDRIKNNWMALTAAIAGAYATIAAGKQFIDSALQMQKMTTTMQAVTSNSTLAARELQYVREESERLGLVFSDTSVAFAKFTATTRNTSIEGEQTRKVFSGVAEAATALKLSGEETNGVFIALGQMMSKGKVQAEELRGQLGERLPGAFKLAAEAMGVSEAELNKMLEDGKVLGTDLLPKLAEKLHETYGKAATEAAKQGQAEINRFNNAVFETKAVLGEALMPALLAALSTLKEFTPVIKDIIGTLQFMAVNTGSFFDKLGVGIKSLGYMFDSDAKAKEQALLAPILQAEEWAKQSVVDQMMGTSGTSSQKSMLELGSEQAKTAAAKTREAEALAKMGKTKGAADAYASTLRQITDETTAWENKIKEMDPSLEKQDSEILKLIDDAEVLKKKIRDDVSKEGIDITSSIARVNAGLETGIGFAYEKQGLKVREDYQKMVDAEVEYGQSENERAANAIIHTEEKKLQELAELWVKSSEGRGITDEEYYAQEARIHSNSLAARLDKETEYAKKVADINYGMINGIRGMEQWAYDLEMQQIEARAASYLKDGADQRAVAAWTANEQQKAWVKLAQKSSSITAGIKAAWYDLYQNQLTWGQASYNVMIDLYRNMGDAFGSSFYDVITGDLDDLSDVWDNFWKSMLTSMTNQLGQMVAQWLLFNTILGSTSGTSFGGMSFGGMAGGGGLGSLANMASLGTTAYSLLGGAGAAGGMLEAGVPLAMSAAEYVPGMAGAGMLGGMGEGAMALFSAIPGWGWALGGGALLAGLFGEDIISGVGDVVSDIGSGIGDVFEDIGDWFGNGAAFSGGRVTPFARGGIFNSPTLFPMANGMGLMGEAGPEAVMPLTRGSDGKLGVKAQGGAGGLVINNLQLFIGGKEFTGEMKAVADGVVVERNKRGLTSSTSRFY